MYNWNCGLKEVRMGVEPITGVHKHIKKELVS